MSDIDKLIREELRDMAKADRAVQLSTEEKGERVEKRAKKRANRSTQRSSMLDDIRKKRTEAAKAAKGGGGGDDIAVEVVVKQRDAAGGAGVSESALPLRGQQHSGPPDILDDVDDMLMDLDSSNSNRYSTGIEAM